MLREERLIEAARNLAEDDQVAQVAVVLPLGAIGQQVAGTVVGGLLGSADGMKGIDLGTAIGEAGTRLGQKLTKEFPAYTLGASPNRLYLFGLHSQGILHDTRGMQLLHTWDRSTISVTDKQVGISHHVTVTSDDGSSLTMEGKMLNTGLPELLKTLNSVHE